MGQESEAIAKKFSAAMAEFAEAVKQLPDSKWGAVCDAEGWTVAQTAEHVAGQFPLEMEFIRAAAEGRTFPSYSWDDINSMNGSRAEKNRGVSKDEVLNTLDESAASVADYIRKLEDEQLDLKGPLGLADGAEVTTRQLLEGDVLIEHIRGHLRSIRAAA